MSSSEVLTLTEDLSSPPGDSRRPPAEVAEERVAGRGAGQEQEEREKNRKKRKMAAPRRESTSTGTVMTTPLGDAMGAEAGRLRSTVCSAREARA